MLFTLALHFVEEAHAPCSSLVLLSVRSQQTASATTAIQHWYQHWYPYPDLKITYTDRKAHDPSI